MKKIMCALCLAMAAGAAFAGMNNRSLSFEVIGTNAVAKTTTVRGDLAGVAVTVPEGATGTVAVTASGETLLSKSGVSASTVFRPVVASCGSTGTAISNQYQRPAIAGTVGVTVTGTGTATNTYKVELIYAQ